jgi:hypothetical protein
LLATQMPSAQRTHVERPLASPDGQAAMFTQGRHGCRLGVDGVNQTGEWISPLDLVMRLRRFLVRLLAACFSGGCLLLMQSQPEGRSCGYRVNVCGRNSAICAVHCRGLRGSEGKSCSWIDISIFTANYMRTACHFPAFYVLLQ